MERGKFHTPFAPLPAEDLTRIRAASRVRLGCKPQTGSAVLELHILIPHTPLGVLSCVLSSPPDFHPFPGLRTRTFAVAASSSECCLL